MVTIEQKLLLFSKLINHSMEKDFQKDLMNLEKQYLEKINQSFLETDNAASSIEDRARKKSETRKTEILSKKNVNIKRDILVQKEKYYYIFMEKFKDRIYEFVKSEEYKDYLLSLVKNVDVKDENLNLEIYLTDSDNKKYSEMIKNEFKNKKVEIEFENTHTIMGGVIIIDKCNNVKMDLSIDSLLEDNKDYILKTLFDSLEEGGDYE